LNSLAEEIVQLERKEVGQRWCGERKTKAVGWGWMGTDVGEPGFEGGIVVVRADGLLNSIPQVGCVSLGLHGESPDGREARRDGMQASPSRRQKCVDA
jgi:hypothetical protein